MNAKHTPGPWKAQRGQTNGATPECWGCVVGDNWTIADIQADVDELKETAEANARLIAAAPEMLELLREYNDSRLIPNELHLKADALLAKIDGQQP